MSVKGIGGRRNLKEEIKFMPKIIKVMKGEKIDKPKERAKRKVETRKRNMEEKALERKIIFSLHFEGCTVTKAGEQSTYNSHLVISGMSDLIVFVPEKGIIFMEVKTEKRRNTKDGGLRPSQVKFRELCEKCGLRYVVVYSISDAQKAVNES